MSFIQKLAGNSVAITKEEAKKQIGDILVPKEDIFASFKGFRDLIIFTNERLIVVDIQGISGKKRSFKSIPYSQISVFTKESAGTLDMNNSIVLYVRAYGTAELNFSKDSDIDSIYQLLSEYVLEVN